MPKNKNAAIRYRVLDRCFRNRRRLFFIDNLVDACNEELMAYGLLDEEKELVKKGEYDPWQFEDDPDEMEEDDYYYDDF